MSIVYSFEYSIVYSFEYSKFDDHHIGERTQQEPSDRPSVSET